MAEKVARLPENIYRTVLNSMEHGYVFMTPDAKITLFNDAACRILDLSADQLKGKATTDRDWGTVREDGAEFPASHHPIMVSLKTQAPCFGVVMGIRVSGGRIRWLSVNSDVVRDPESGEIAGSVATFSDISAQINQKKYLEERLEDLRSSSRATTENVSYLTATLLSLVAEITEANRRLSATLGPDAEAARKHVQLIELKTGKLAFLLSQKRNG